MGRIVGEDIVLDSRLAESLPLSPFPPGVVAPCLVFGLAYALALPLISHLLSSFHLYHFSSSLAPLDDQP